MVPDLYTELYIFIALPALMLTLWICAVIPIDFVEDDDLDNYLYAYDMDATITRTISPSLFRSRTGRFSTRSSRSVSPVSNGNISPRSRSPSSMRSWSSRLSPKSGNSIGSHITAGSIYGMTKRRARKKILMQELKDKAKAQK